MAVQKCLFINLLDIVSRMPPIIREQPVSKIVRFKSHKDLEHITASFQFISNQHN